MEYHCPFCEYTSDGRESVEAHITGKTDSRHTGKIGRMYRSEILDKAEPDSVTELVLRKTGRDDTRLTEIEKLRDKIEGLTETTEQLQERVNRLDRQIDEIHKTEQNIEEIAQDTEQSIEEFHQEAEQNKTVLKNVDKILRSMMERDEPVLCPYCNNNVDYTKPTYEGERGFPTDYTILYCRNCETSPITGQLK